jgi:protein-disulfide isomerase
MSQSEPSLVLPAGERDHSQGPSEAPVTLVEYGDYQCPYCGRAYAIVKAVQDSLGENLRFIFRNFPITTSHEHAQHAAEAAEAAAVQGKFWEMHDLLFENQAMLDDDHLLGFAEQLGLDLSRFEADMAGHHFADRVREDFMSGVRSGVNGTPTFFINGTRFDESWDQETLTAAIEDAAQSS